MNDIEIRLHCIEAAGGDLSIAKQLYNWATDRNEPVAGGMIGWTLGHGPVLHGHPARPLGTEADPALAF